MLYILYEFPSSGIKENNLLSALLWGFMMGTTEK